MVDSGLMPPIMPILFILHSSVAGTRYVLETYRGAGSVRMLAIAPGGKRIAAGKIILRKHTTFFSCVQVRMKGLKPAKVRRRAWTCF
jgi:hypothetical protein